MKTIDLNLYKNFVDQVTSENSNSLDSLTSHLKKLNNEVNIALLLTGAIGIASEGGEFAEIVKKCVFQGKPMDADTQFHAKRELGDIIWYWVNSCRALNLDPNDVIQENITKLLSRYPGGSFDAWHSEHRQKGDL
jgi:NTP pyrophosphatase (non-canonical NTP hydrolase)